MSNRVFSTCTFFGLFWGQISDVLKTRLDLSYTKVFTSRIIPDTHICFLHELYGMCTTKMRITELYPYRLSFFREYHYLDTNCIDLARQVRDIDEYFEVKEIIMNKPNHRGEGRLW